MLARAHAKRFSSSCWRSLLRRGGCGCGPAPRRARPRHPRPRRGSPRARATRAGACPRSVERHAHRAHEMRPLVPHRLVDGGIAGQAMDRGMERHVGRHELADLGGIVQREPIGQRLVRGAPLLGPDHSGLHAPRGQAGGHPVERLAHLVEIAHPLRLHRRHHQPALAVLDQQAAALQDLQRVADRLPRHAQHLGNAFLGEPLLRRQRPVDDRGQQPVVHLVDQGRNGAQRDQHGVPRRSAFPSFLAC